MQTTKPGRGGWFDRRGLFMESGLKAEAFLRQVEELKEDGLIEEDLKSREPRYRLRETTVVEAPSPTPADLRRLKSRRK
jgi:hypothetical protein